MGELGDLIQAHRDRQKYPPTPARLAKEVGITRQTMSNWLNGKSLPEPENLRELARVIETPYSVVLRAALADSGYVREEMTDHERPAAITQAGESPAPVSDPDGTRGADAPGTQGSVRRAAPKGSASTPSRDHAPIRSPNSGQH